MTAKSSPNHSSEISNSAQEQQHFLCDDANTQLEYDPDYVPEREFVLMPLFRRVGEMLGIRRRGEDREHIYAPELIAPQRSAAELEHLSAPAAPVTEDHNHAASSAIPEAEVSYPPTEHKIEREIAASEQPEPVMAAEAREPESELLPASADVQPEPEPAIMHQEQVDPEPAVVAQAAEESFVAPIIASTVNRTTPPAAPIVQPLAAQEARPQQAPPARPVLTQEDIAQLVAPITEAAREAATKISTAVSQAAERLHATEEEILRRAELALESKRAGASQAPLTDAPKWESNQASALQRGEVAWHETGGIAVARKEESRQAERRPAAVEPRRPGLWKRIDWAQEFTPKRVAVLGGVAMAMLIVVGVSLARRPASSVLPQQTHAIQPGGVTLTAHPKATTAPVTVPAARQVNPAPQRQAITQTRSSKRSASSDGPDVVTHYYGKQSPSHQSPVTGVKHYSDMESR